MENNNYFFNQAHEKIARERYYKRKISDDGTSFEFEENDIFDSFNRVVEKIYSKDNEVYKNEMLQYMKEKKFIPGGRILAQAGTEIEQLYNCFVLGIGDSREEISESKRLHFNIQSSGGGTGFNFSKLRPAGSWCKTAKSRSSGPIGFMVDISYQSANISQGGNRCLYEEALVAMADGSWKKIKDVKVGDLVIAYDLKTQHTEPSKVINFYDNGKQDVYSYEFENGLELSCTQNHRWFCGNDKISEINLSNEINKVAFVRNIPFFGNKKCEYPNIIAGIINSDIRHSSQGEIILLSDCDKVKDLYKNELDEIVKKYKGVRYNEYDCGIELFITGEFISFLEKFGEYNLDIKSRYIYDIIFEYRREDIKKIIENLYYVNGFIDNKKIMYCSLSKRLVKDIRRLLLKFNITGYIVKSNTKNDNIEKEFYFYIINHPESYNNFIDNFKINKDVRKLDINDFENKDNYLSSNVYCKNNVLYGVRTCCIEIDHQDHLFIVDDGGISHNSGANLGLLEDWHPDLYNFIHCKSNSNWESIRSFSSINNEEEFIYWQWNNNYPLQMFNISVALSDNFMERVINNSNELWEQKWKDQIWYLWDYEYKNKIITVSAPNQQMAFYNSQKKIPFFNDDNKLILKRGPYQLTCKEWFSLICKNAWKDGCPGIFFIDKSRKYHNGEYFAPMEAANPCGEQILPKNSVCCLSCIILPNFIKYKENETIFDYDELRKVIRASVRFLDNVIDISKTNEKCIDEQVQKERRIGLSTTGMADILIAFKLKYSSEEGRNFVDKILSFVRDEAYLASIDLAKERGSFPNFEYVGYSKSLFFKKLPKYIQEKIKHNGIRNVTILTQAPIGTTGTMLGYSTGCEPHFNLLYKRNSRVGVFYDGCQEYIKWYNDNFKKWLINNKKIDKIDIDKNGIQNFEEKYKNEFDEYEKTIRPDYFEYASIIKPEDHLFMQAIYAKNIDSSVSKTINLPNTATIEDVENAYILAYKLDIKSTTIYRDGSKQQILENIVNIDKRPEKLAYTSAPKRPKIVDGYIYKTHNSGNDWRIIIGLYYNRPYEIFAFECNSDNDYKNSEIEKKLNKVSQTDGVKIKILRVKSGHYKLLDEEGNEIIDYLNNKATTDITLETRRISLELRHGIPIAFIVDQINKSNQTLFSFSRAVARILKSHMDYNDDMFTLEQAKKEYGSSKLKIIRQEGCLMFINEETGEVFSKCN